MTLSRRAVLAGGAAGLGALALPRFTIAETSVLAGKVMTISDGFLTLPTSFILGEVPAEVAEPILASYGATGSSLESPCNVTLYRDDERVILFDAGSGSEFMPTAGDLIDGLDAVGIAPDEVTDIVFTHAHPDHLWGILDDFGDPAFPEANLLIGNDEWDYWTDAATVDRIDPGRQAFAVGAKRRLELVGEQITLFGDGDEVLPGVKAVATYGHTPGHMSFEIGGEDGVFVIGDAIANGHLSLANPAWKMGSDQAPEQAAETRVALINKLSQRAQRVVGYHLPDGGLGRIAKVENGYRFEGEDL